MDLFVMRCLKHIVSLSLLIGVSVAFIPAETYACGHDGFYVGAGYTQRHLFTFDKRLTVGGGGERIIFGPGFGGHLIFGYDFCPGRVGIQFPISYTTLRLNYAERVSLISGSVEGVFHLASWPNGLDAHLIGGGGWSYISEGSIDNRSSNHGVHGTLGPGLSWYFRRDKDVRGALTGSMPFRVTYFIGNQLSSNGAIVFEVPLRISVTVSF